MTTRVQRSQLLFALAPLALGAVIWSTWRLPAAPEGSLLQLAGTWRAIPGETRMDVPNDDPRWVEVRVPGSFTRQHVAARWVLLRRAVKLPAQLRGRDLVLQLSAVRLGSARLAVNGTVIGQKGNPSTGFIGAASAVDEFLISADLVPDARFELSVLVNSLCPGIDGIPDPRVLLGPPDVVVPWAFHGRTVRNTFELGGLLALSLLLGLVLVLRWIERAQPEHRLFRGTVTLLSAAIFYVMNKSGFILAWLLPPTVARDVSLSSAMMIGIAIPEFIEAYYVGRVTWFRQLNRTVGVVALVAGLLVPGKAYGVYANWLVVVVAWCSVLAVRDAIKRGPSFSLATSSAIAVLIAAGGSDVLTDLDVRYAPRLLTLAVINIGFVAGALVVGEFLRIAQDNTKLSASLAQRNEELKVALEAAEQSSRAKSEFLSSTSHELRTPLNSIINIPQGMLDTLTGVRFARCERCQGQFELEHDEVLRPDRACPACGTPGLREGKTAPEALEPASLTKLLASVVASGRHLLSVVNDILDFSKLEAGRMVLHHEPIEVRALLSELELTMGPFAQRAGVKLEVHPVDARFEADRVKLTQVLLNLTGNAIKFSDGRGIVRVRALADERTITLSVQDEGVGIAPEHQGLIFEGFRQVEGGSTRRFGGTGLGLAITRRLVELHGGTISLASALGKGTTMTVRLPTRKS